MSEDRRLEWSAAAAASWLSDVVAALGLKRHLLLGLSIGGWISLAYSVGEPVGLGALALLCPSGIGRARPSFMLKGALAMARGRKGLESLSRTLYGDATPHEEAIRVGTTIAESTNPRMEAPPIFTDEDLGRIAAPVFLGVGTKDALLDSRETAARLKAAKPDADIRVIEGAGHALIGLGGSVAEFFEAHERAINEEARSL